eukprot:6488886-Amphidinium_carterae.1
MLSQSVPEVAMPYGLPFSLLSTNETFALVCECLQWCFRHISQYHVQGQFSDRCNGRNSIVLRRRVASACSEEWGSSSHCHPHSTAAACNTSMWFAAVWNRHQGMSFTDLEQPIDGLGIAAHRELQTHTFEIPVKCQVLLAIQS